jgi:excisionase family DNA binding protein
MSTRRPKEPKGRGKGRRTPGGPPDPPRRPVQRLAVSSGEAARHCLVSTDTIANWIASGRLPAQRTAGGQYRIRLLDLRAFMGAHGMRTERLDEELGEALLCWQYWSGRGGPYPPATCAECPVYLGRTQICHEVRPLLPGGIQRALSCAECDFAQKRSGNFLFGFGEPDAEGSE